MHSFDALSYRLDVFLTYRTSRHLDLPLSFLSIGGQHCEVSICANGLLASLFLSSA
jgi:hypothetical protein